MRINKTQTERTVKVKREREGGKTAMKKERLKQDKQRVQVVERQGSREAFSLVVTALQRA